MRWSESPSERILRIRRDSTIESWSEELELESGGLGVSSQGLGVRGQESGVSSQELESGVGGKSEGQRPESRLAHEHVCGPSVILTTSVKGAREGARVKIMLVGRPQTAGRASRSGAGLAFGRRQQAAANERAAVTSFRL